MKNTAEEKEFSDIDKIKKFLVGLDFICNSLPSAQHQIYSKNGEIVMIKNRNNNRGEK